MKKKAAKSTKKKAALFASPSVILPPPPPPKQFVIAAIKRGVSVSGGYFTGGGKWGRKADAKTFLSGSDLVGGVLLAQKELPPGASGISVFPKR